MRATPTTSRGRETRERIVRSAAGIAEHGVAGTSLDDVRAATGASKSQLYHYFGDKHGLVKAVVDYQCATVLGVQTHALGSVDYWGSLQRWAEAMVAVVDEQGPGWLPEPNVGCSPLRHGRAPAYKSERGVSGLERRPPRGAQLTAR